MGSLITTIGAYIGYSGIVSDTGLNTINHGSVLYLQYNLSTLLHYVYINNILMLPYPYLIIIFHIQIYIYVFCS